MIEIKIKNQNSCIIVKLRDIAKTNIPDKAPLVMEVMIPCSIGSWSISEAPSDVIDNGRPRNAKHAYL